MKLTKRIFCGALVSLLLGACSATDTADSENVAAKMVHSNYDSAGRVLGNNVVGNEKHQVRYRENIDSLSPEKLAAYVHAVAMMKKKSEENVFDRTGFLWQAWVHNCTNVTVNESRELSVDNVYDIKTCNFSNLLPSDSVTHKENPGMCEHAKDTFFQWHRAEFYFYEKALQNADPLGLYGPSTTDVTVPYWNFTHPPTGKRFPKVFEDSSSTLYVDNRNTDPLPDGTSYTSPYLLAYQLYYLDWSKFGGYPSGGEGNYGEFEAQIHNPMHDDYIGGYLITPPTAGLDPLFYAFHAYIDYIFEKWIEIHGSDNITGGRYFARGEQSATLPKPIDFSEGSGSKRPPGNYTKNMGRGEIYLDSQKQGYAYKPGPQKEFITKEELDKYLEFHREKNKAFGVGEESLYSFLLSGGQRKPSEKPNALFTNGINFSEANANLESAMLNIVRTPTHDDYSFQADVYLYPESVNGNIADENFRKRYLVVSTDYWALDGHHHSDGHTAQSLKLSQVITDTIQSIYSNKDKENRWTLAIAISSDFSGEYQFESPVINFK